MRFFAETLFNEIMQIIKIPLKKNDKDNQSSCTFLLIQSAGYSTVCLGAYNLTDSKFTLGPCSLRSIILLEHVTVRIVCIYSAKQRVLLNASKLAIDLYYRTYRPISTLRRFMVLIVDQLISVEFYPQQFISALTKKFQIVWFSKSPKCIRLAIHILKMPLKSAYLWARERAPAIGPKNGTPGPWTFSIALYQYFESLRRIYPCTATYCTILFQIIKTLHR